MRHSPLSLLTLIACLSLTAAGHSQAPRHASHSGGDLRPFSRENLLAWCIVPFDGKNRGPAERAEMLQRLGLRRVAYDWRENHVPMFEEEILEYKRHGIEYFAFWSTHEEAFKLFEKHGLRPQIWQTLPSPPGETQVQRVEAAVTRMLPLVERTRKLGSKLGLYNHGGWGGEPENLVAVCRHLRQQHDAQHVGIIYNLHHAHDRIDDFAASLALMKPYLLCLNLNGMTRDGERSGRRILPLGAGELDVKLLSIIRDSGYVGPIGIIGHTQDDVELRLKDNLDGLDWILPQLEGKPPGAKSKFRTWAEKSEAIQGHAQHHAPSRTSTTTSVAPAYSVLSTEYSPQLIASLVERARREGDPHRGLMVYSSARSACLSCHKLGPHGGTVGPELTAVGRQRKPEEIVEAVLWPKRQVKPEYVAHAIIDSSGRSHQGYIVRRDEKQLVLRDPTKGDAGELTFEVGDIEESREVGTLMPDNLVALFSQEQLADLLRLLFELGGDDSKLTADEMQSLLAHAHVHARGPASFPYDRKPLQPEHWPSWQHHVNRDRLYDFYAKEADYFRQQTKVPSLLPDYPGIDGGTLGHWGNQDDQVWADDRWNNTQLGSLQCGVLRAGRVTVPRGVCVRLGDRGELAACFNPDTLTYDAVWSGGFVKFSSARHGFMHGLVPDGKLQPRPQGTKPEQEFKYHGFYRHGNRVLFAYRLGDTEMLDVPWAENGRFTRMVAPREQHPLRHLLETAPAQWPQQLETPVDHGTLSPYAIDTIGMPFENPWNALLFCGGHAFLPDGSALVCTIQGDVWRVDGFEYPATTALWRRFAAGLHHALGLVVDQDGIFVLGRDQITRLHDLNGDGEADFYECFSNAYQTSPAGHDFICGLERDADGNFYTASGNQGLVRISADGRRAEVFATGFRNPDGLGLLPDGTLTVPCSEGEWTPASMICAVRSHVVPRTTLIPHFGYQGPKEGRTPDLPLVYLPRGLDNSSGGQTVVTGDRWGPLAGQLLHFSFGTGSHFLVLRDEVDGQLQGAVVPLPGEFRSGVHRGRFNPADGQLYVTGMQGWGSYTADDGCFQRVRYTGGPVQLPTAFHVFQNGVSVKFSLPLEPETAGQSRSHFAQCWNYRYGPGYGSAEFSTLHAGMRGHDALTIASAHVLADGHTLFLEVPDLQPVNQLHLRVQSAADVFHDLFLTVHKLDVPFTGFPDYRAGPTKTIRPHPILADLVMAARSIPNPHRAKIEGARPITIETGSNLSFATRSLTVRAGEPISLTLANPDVVPHNWALIKPGTLERVGGLADRLISDPEAALWHYIPRTTDILAYTDVVDPREKFTIYFRAPEQPGRYPYFCTFPGHWKVMNGEMLVEPAEK